MTFIRIIPECNDKLILSSSPFFPSLLLQHEQVYHRDGKE